MKRIVSLLAAVAVVAATALRRSSPFAGARTADDDDQGHRQGLQVRALEEERDRTAR